MGWARPVFTILHISDLHRSPTDPIENSTLLGSLLSDMDRYNTESSPIPVPDAAIVSGDIIQGVTLNFAGYADELTRQYGVAYDFLSTLADRVFDGDHSKVVLIPGNHDVCWNTARSAMQAHVEATPGKLNARSFSSDTSLRWDWETRQIFEISNKDIYKRRLEAYWKFVERFYTDAALTYPLDFSRGFNLFALDSGRIIVAALESVHGNDCFCRQGSVERSVLGACALAIRDLPQQPILKAATWHHSFQGPPAGDDYMDISAIHELIGLGFRLGLHGHQHLAEANAHSIHLPEEEVMAISSAASLCAGRRELPTGANRGYNLIVIDDDYSSCRIHVRESIQGNQFGRYTRGIFKVDGYVRLRWTLPPSPMTAISGGKSRFNAEAIVRAEDALHAGNPTEALKILDTANVSNHTHGRRIYIQAAKSLGRHRTIIDLIGEPTSIEEFIELFAALLGACAFADAQKLLGRGASMGVDLVTLGDLRDQLEFKSRFGGQR